jgi:hypothetical protein
MCAPPYTIMCIQLYLFQCCISVEKKLARELKEIKQRKNNIYVAVEKGMLPVNE